MFSLALPALLSPGAQVTATATDSADNTSEFSACRPAVCSASMPGGAFVLQLEPDRLTWSGPPGAGAFDLVRGDLATLRATGGDYAASTLECLANDFAANTSPYVTQPQVGEGSWFLVRGTNCAGSGTYDSGAASQVGSRDAEIAASSGACP